jgi:hypothetical protein
MNWLERARREIEESDMHTDVADERNLTSVMAVPLSPSGQKSRTPAREQGSEVESDPPHSDKAINQTGEGAEWGTDNSDERTLTSLLSVPHSGVCKISGALSFGKGRVFSSSGEERSENEKAPNGVLTILTKEEKKEHCNRTDVRGVRKRTDVTDVRNLLEDRSLTLAETLDLARTHRVSVTFAGGRQVFVGADHPPPADVVIVLRRVGTDLLALIPPVNDPWLFADWRWFFKERADGAEQSGLARAEAKARAFECCVIEWLNRHLFDSPSHLCCWCGGIERADENNPLLPFGVGPHAWVHDRCWERWRDWRRGEAVAALAALGIAIERSKG